MRRYLVVANQTLGGERLLELLSERCSRGPCSFHVVVPASVDPNAWTQDLASERQLARSRLDRALERFGQLGSPVTGEVGDTRPLDAIRDVLRREDRFDEIILSTLPAGISRWLKADLVSQVQRAVDLPVTHVIGEDAPVGGR